ncbi:hypothetical protein GLN3_14790 [Geobacillus lituanicus]|nr:hypothetical protein GLN3_14790 [Geobacillus lituanicus]
MINGGILAALYNGEEKRKRDVAACCRTVGLGALPWYNEKKRPCELPTTYASLRDGGFERLVCVRRTVSHTQEPFTLPFVPKVSVLAIFYPIRWLTPTDIHLPLSLRFEVGDFFRKDVKLNIYEEESGKCRKTVRCDGAPRLAVFLGRTAAGVLAGQMVPSSLKA